MCQSISIFISFYISFGKLYFSKNLSVLSSLLAKSCHHVLSISIECVVTSHSETLDIGHLCLLFYWLFFLEIIDFIPVKKRLSVMISLLHTFYFIDCSCILYYFFSSALFVSNWLFFFYIHKVKA